METALMFWFSVKPKPQIGKTESIKLYTDGIWQDQQIEVQVNRVGMEE